MAMLKARYIFQIVLLSLFLLTVFFIKSTSPSPVPGTDKQSAETDNGGDSSGDDRVENPVFDMEYSGDLGDQEDEGNDTTSIRSRRHEKDPRFYKLFCRVGLYLEMNKDGSLKGTGEEGIDNARLFEIPDGHAFVTLRNQKTNKFIAIDENGGLTSSDIETDASRFIKEKNGGAYRTLKSLTKYKEAKTQLYLGMDSNGTCQIVDGNSTLKDFLFVEAEPTEETELDKKDES